MGTAFLTFLIPLMFVFTWGWQGKIDTRLGRVEKPPKFKAGDRATWCRGSNYSITIVDFYYTNPYTTKCRYWIMTDDGRLIDDITEIELSPEQTK